MEERYDIADVRAFGLIAAAGGVSAAARRFGLSKARLSRALARLEAAAGAPLVDRLSRGLRLTPLGESLRPAAEEAVRIAREADEILRTLDAEPAGVLRLAASALTSQEVLAPVLAAFARRHPAVEVSLQVTSRAPDPLAEDLDLVLRVGRPPEPYLVARRIVSGTLKLYLPRERACALDPSDPDAVTATERIVIDAPGVPAAWELTDGHHRIVIDAPPAMRVADPSGALGVMAAGTGLAFLPDLYGDPLVAAGRLARALPGWSGPELEIHAVLPPRRTAVPAVRAFLDLLTAHVRTMKASGLAPPASGLAGSDITR